MCVSPVNNVLITPGAGEEADGQRSAEARVRQRRAGLEAAARPPPRVQGGGRRGGVARRRFGGRWPVSTRIASPASTLTQPLPALHTHKEPALFNIFHNDPLQYPILAPPTSTLTQTLLFLHIHE